MDNVVTTDNVVTIYNVVTMEKGITMDNVRTVDKFVTMDNHSAGKHDRGPLFFTLFLFRLIRSRSTGSI